MKQTIEHGFTNTVAGVIRLLPAECEVKSILTFKTFSVSRSTDKI